ATGNNTVLRVELSGASAGADANGLVIAGGGSTVRGLAINRFSGVGILIPANGSNTIEGNFIGTDLSGTAAAGNAGNGIEIFGSPGNTIGGAAAGARNVLSGNGNNGVAVSGAGAAGTLIAGNSIG